MQQYLEGGKIVSAHGTRGECKILPWTDTPDFLLQFHTLYFDGTPREVESIRKQGTCVLCKFKGIDTMEDAVRLRGQIVCFDRSDAKLKPGAVFICDLIGMRVLCGETEIGKITEVLQPPANDVYVVKGVHEYMIPAVKDFVKEVRPEEGWMRVELIEGMRTDED